MVSIICVQKKKPALLLSGAEDICKAGCRGVLEDPQREMWKVLRYVFNIGTAQIIIGAVPYGAFLEERRKLGNPLVRRNRL